MAVPVWFSTPFLSVISFVTIPTLFRDGVVLCHAQCDIESSPPECRLQLRKSRSEYRVLYVCEGEGARVRRSSHHVKHRWFGSSCKHECLQCSRYRAHLTAQRSTREVEERTIPGWTGCSRFHVSLFTDTVFLTKSVKFFLRQNNIPPNKTLQATPLCIHEQILVQALQRCRNTRTDRHELQPQGSDSQKQSYQSTTKLNK